MKAMWGSLASRGVAGPGTRSRHGPVVAADGILRIAHGPSHGIMQGGRKRTGRQDAFRVRLAQQERLVQRPVAQVPPGDFRNVDDREAHGQVVLKLAPDGERVNRMPWFGCVVQQRELYGRVVAALLHHLVDARGKGLQAAGNRVLDDLPLRLGDARETDRPGNGVPFKGCRRAARGLRAGLGTQNLGQAAVRLSAVVVQLPQTVLGHGIAVARVQIRIRIGVDVGNAALVAQDADGSRNRRGALTVLIGHPLFQLSPPPGLEAGMVQACLHTGFPWGMVPAQEPEQQGGVRLRMLHGCGNPWLCWFQRVPEGYRAGFRAWLRKQVF